MRLVAILLVAELLTMVAAFAFAALLPDFSRVWNLTSTEAGWINGIFFGAYAAVAPVALGLTDRIDARRIYLVGAFAAASAALAFALFADGFWTALAFRAAAGAGLAGTYMPGLRALVDRYRGRRQPRAVSVYTAGFSLGTALSFLVAGQVGAAFGWQWAFGVAAAAALGGFALVALWLRPVSPAPAPGASRTFFFGFRSVLGNRGAMGYVLAYGAHSMELFALRSWLVAFLVFSLTMQPGGSGWPAPTIVAMLSGLVAVAASIGGQELAVRYGLRRVIALAMVASAAMALVLGFLPSLPYALVVVLVLIYSAAVQADSAALTIGTIGAAAEGRRGATLAVHALVGFGGAALGPLILGIVLDAGGGAVAPLSWGLAFAAVGATALLGPVALGVLRGRDSDPPRPG